MRTTIDCHQPLPRTRAGSRYLLVFLDLGSRWPILAPLRNSTAKDVVRVIREKIIPTFGTPEKLIFDNSSIFRSKILKEYATECDIQLAYTALYDPERSPAERCNRVVKQCMRMYIDEDHKTWDAHIPEIQLALVNSISESSGYSPAQLCMGRQLRVPGEPYRRLDVDPNVQINPKRHFDELRSQLSQAYRKAVEKVKTASKRQASYYNMRHRKTTLKVGQWVYRKNHQLSDASADFAQKLAPRFVGPFRIDSAINEDVFRLADVNGKDAGTWHAKDLKLQI